MFYTAAPVHCFEKRNYFLRMGLKEPRRGLFLGRKRKIIPFSGPITIDTSQLLLDSKRTENS